MTEETASVESKLDQIAKRVEDQARFTRTVVVICTTALLGVNFYMLSEIFGNLSYVFIARYMENLDKIVHQWNAIESLRETAGASQQAPASAPAAEQPASK